MGHTVKIVLDTEAGPFFIKLRDLPVECQIHELPSDIPRIDGASCEVLQLLAVSEVVIQVSSLKNK